MKRSIKFFVWWYFGWIRLNLSQFMRMCLTGVHWGIYENVFNWGTLHIEHIGVSSLFRSNVGVANAKSKEYHFFSIFSVVCWPLTNSILHMVELVYLIIPGYLPFMYKFVNGWLGISVEDFCFGYVCQKCFFVALSALWFPFIPMWLDIQVRMMLLFYEREFILFRSFGSRGVNLSLFFSAKRTDLECE